VQSFIAQARKTQDLYAGSRILSDLIKTAIDAVGRENIVFPYAPQDNTKWNDIKSLPNRFVAMLSSDSNVEAIAQKAKESVENEWKKIAQKALFKITPPNGFWQQIEAHLDINWAAIPCTDDYRADYAKLECLLGAVKNMRLINNHNPEKGRKCSLDGERNALFFGPNSNPNYVPEKNMIVKRDNRLHPNEGLSAVSFVKRAINEPFPSTAAVALSQQIERIKELNPDIKKIWECYQNLFSKDYIEVCMTLLKEKCVKSINIENKRENWCIDFDEQLFFEENLTSRNIPNETQLQIAKKLHQKLKSHLTQNHYALIAFDGDKMGTLLSGECLKDKTTDLAKFQGKLSSLLMNFSQWIRCNLNKGEVHVIYAGGDDFLGFVNLHHLFEVVQTLRIEFDRQVNQELQKCYPLGEQGNPYHFTFSMGIVIAHYKTPLSIVLQTARDMEKLAKDQGERDAFAIAALKHSGENHQAYFKWGKLNTDEPLPAWNALKKLIAYFENDCSDTFVRNLDREFYLLQDSKGKLSLPSDYSMAMIKSELLRLAHRSLEEDKKNKAQELCNTVYTFFTTEDKKTRQSVALKNGTEATKIALFIKRQTKK